MFFPISHAYVNPIYLIVVGFVIGVLGGFFGVGGSFIAGPALRLAGIDWNFDVGQIGADREIPIDADEAQRWSGDKTSAHAEEPTENANQKPDHDEIDRVNVGV